MPEINAKLEPTNTLSGTIMRTMGVDVPVQNGTIAVGGISADDYNDFKDAVVRSSNNESDIDNLTSRVENIATLPSGSTTADAELIDIRVGADGNTYPNAGTAVRTQVSELKQDLVTVKNSLYKVESTNKFNKNAITENKHLNVSGEEVSSITTFISDYMKVSNGDIVYLTILNASGNYLSPSNCNAFRICVYDNAKNFVTYSDYANSYTVAIDGFIRVSLVNSCLTAICVCVTINNYPTSATIANCVYFEPYYKCVDVEARNAFGYVDTKTIDCWGDSRIENGSAGTPIPTYISRKLGSKYTVNNYGKSSQTSGEIAMRFGTNEVYVSIEGNEIPATTTPINITSVICSSGSRFNFDNLYNLSINKPVECYLNGVKGYFDKHTVNTPATFTRAEEGDVISVSPNSKLWVDENDSDIHIVIIWVGKNDQTTAGDTWYKTGVLSNIKSMVDRLKHDHFIILSDTNSTSNSQNKSTNWYKRIISLNEEIAKRYPNNYIDVRTKLIQTGLSDAGLTPTDNDNEWISVDCIPMSLMADEIHLNGYGKELVARYICQFMVEKGWIFY